MHTALLKLARPLECLLGLTFIVAAVLKAQDLNLFVGQVYSYQVVKAPETLRLVALSTLGIETFLGVAMVLGLRLRMLVLSLVLAMLLVFTGLIFYAWIFHGIEDCGCFGRVKFTPPAAIAKNLVMFVAAVIAWRGIHLQGEVKQGGALWRTLVSLVAAIGLTVWSAPQLSGATAAPPEVEPPAAPTAEPGPAAAPGPPPAGQPGPVSEAAPFAQFQVATELGETLDLGKDEYLVVSLSMTCEHCQTTVPQLNDLAYCPGLPKLVGLAYVPEEGSLEEFKALTTPAFPLHSIGNDFILFSQFIGKAPPRLYHVKDGKEVQHWDAVEPEYQFPSCDDLLAATPSGPQSTPPGADASAQ